MAAVVASSEHAVPLFFAAAGTAAVVARLPVDPAALPTMRPVWGLTANLAVLAARLRFIGCRRVGGLSTGDLLAEGAKYLGRKLARLPDRRLADGEGRATAPVGERLNEVPVAAGPDGCGEAAELLIVYVGRERAANGLGGRLWSRLRGLPAAPIEFVLFIDESGAAWAAADPMVGDMHLQTLVAAPGGRWAE
eukprot:6853476-Alexandrium_andersonii.AAC.1